MSSSVPGVPATLGSTTGKLRCAWGDESGRRLPVRGHLQVPGARADGVGLKNLGRVCVLGSA